MISHKIQGNALNFDHLLKVTLRCNFVFIYQQTYCIQYIYLLNTLLYKVYIRITGCQPPSSQLYLPLNQTVVFP